MVDRMILLVGIIVLCVLSCAVGGALVAFAVARRPAPVAPPAADPLAPLAEQVARLADEQRHAHDETLSRLLETNRALLEQERVRAGSELDGKKSLIDQQLVTMTGELDKVSELVRTLDGGQRKAYGELSNELRRQHEGLTALSEHTQSLREALASSKARGQWGEPMAEDVLRLAGILDDAMRNKIVVCSPLTLYAVLAVVRQAVDNFQLERTSSEILALLGEFSRQWEKYAAQLEKVQQRFEQVGKEYSSLMTTRHRALQRPLDKIEHLRHEERGLLDADIAPLTFPELSAGS